MKNFIQAGSLVTIPAPYNVSSGQVVISGAIIGVASGTALSGASVDLATMGVFRLAKVGANVFAVGAQVYYDTATKLCTSTTSGNTKIGVAVEAAGAGAADVAVRLSGF